MYWLKNRGFQNHDISALYSDEVVDAAASVGQEPVVAASGPTPLSGELAWLQGSGEASVPGYVAAGPIARALKRAEGPASSRIGRSLMGLGVPETEAKSFQRKIKQGSVLISFHTEHTDEINRAQTILQTSGGEDFCGTDESMPTEEHSMFGETPVVLV
ncbi:MAG: hypothetical protein JWM16_981 [Verrucomicrobiales bacterium]|nr:hypothetical protein [Verrucomicrobiales bacterium]